MMIAKISEDYYSLEKYEISDNYYFDIWWGRSFLTISHQQLARTMDKKA